VRNLEQLLVSSSPEGRPLPANLVANDRVSFSPFDSASSQQMIVCQVPEVEGGIVHYAVPAWLHVFLRLFDGERTTEAAIQEYCSTSATSPTKQQMERLVRGFLVPRGILLVPGTPASRLAVVRRTHRDRRQEYLRFKINLLPARVTYPLAQVLRTAFTPVAIWLGVLIAVCAHIWFYLQLIPRGQLNVNALDAKQLLIIMLVSTVGGIVHELGHATALVHYGGKHPSIGWGVYFVFTVLYTDLSEAWRLSRRQRAVIDLAGIYFQSLFLALLLLLFWATHNPIFLYSFLWINLQMAGDLNPFLRMDGYWFVSDVLGLVNLRQQVQSLFLQTVRSKRPVSSHSLTLPNRTRWLLRAYVLFSLVFFVYLARWIFVQAVFHVLPSYPGMVEAFWRNVLVHSHGAPPLLLEFIEVLWRSIFLLGLLSSIKSLAQWLWRMMPSAKPQVQKKSSNWKEAGA